MGKSFRSSVKIRTSTSQEVRVLTRGTVFRETITVPPPQTASEARLDKIRAQTVLTVLTGRRPELLERTLKSLQERSPGLFHNAEVHILVNGADEPSLSLALRQKVFVHTTPQLLPIGKALSFLMRCVLQSTQRKYLMHLEDDWLCLSGDAQWLVAAAQFVSEGVGQVRLRHMNEIVCGNHLVTLAPIVWKALSPNAKCSPRAHYTFNPSLVSTEVAQQVFPCTSERHAMEKFDQLKLPVVQLLPGAFKHMGNDQSLADRTDGR